MKRLKKLNTPGCNERKIQQAILELQQLQQQYRGADTIIVYHAIDIAFKVITNGIEGAVLRAVIPPDLCLEILTTVERQP